MRLVSTARFGCVLSGLKLSGGLIAPFCHLTFVLSFHPHYLVEKLPTRSHLGATTGSRFRRRPVACVGILFVERRQLFLYGL